jgi:hypothetical protein
VIFEECQALGTSVDAIDFAKKFMQSKVAEELDSMNPGVYSTGVAPLFGYTLRNISAPLPCDKDKYVNENVLFWVGYIYRYWNRLLGTSSKEIVENAPVEYVLDYYPAYHGMDNVEAVHMMSKR